MNDLDEVVEAAEALHRETAQLASGARRWRRLRARGLSMSEIVGDERNRSVLTGAARVARAAAGLLSRLRTIVVEALSREGWTRRQLAGLIGVTHQRISKIARLPDHSDRPLTRQPG